MMRFLIRLLRDLRLVPVVLCATIALFALKALGLVFDGGYLFDNVVVDRDDVEITGSVGAPEPARRPAGQPPLAPLPSSKPASKPASKPVSKPSWAQEMFNYPGAPASAAATPQAPPAAAPPRPTALPSLDITGAVGEPPSGAKEEKPAAAESAAKKGPQEAPPAINGTPVPLEIDHPVSPAERAILESLQKRRAELDARARDLDVREDLLRAAEKRVGGRIEELKELEARIGAVLQQRDEGEAARFKNVVTMYETMKAKDAAKIFDGLDIKVLLDVARDINPRNMSEILAQMTPEKAQRLTAELAARPAQKDHASEMDLPKIQGKPAANGP
jgi:flagellar motility protein MotE (MotC chaperone)